VSRLINSVHGAGILETFENQAPAKMASVTFSEAINRLGHQKKGLG